MEVKFGPRVTLIKGTPEELLALLSDAEQEALRANMASEPGTEARKESAERHIRYQRERVALDDAIWNIGRKYW